MPWIRQFAKGSFGVFSGNTIENFQPIDFYHFFPLWYDVWIKQIVRVIQKLKLEDKSFEEVRHLLPTPSNLRAILVKIIPTYQRYQEQDREACKLVTNFFARMLLESCPKDPFAISSNPYHSDSEISSLMRGIKWQETDVQQARKIGQLVTAAGSLVHGLYNDIVTDFGWDTYGPYDVTLNEMPHSLLIRHFPNLSPTELWPSKYQSSAKELVIYALYQDVEWKISGVGCHTVNTSGNPVQGMRKFAVLVDKKYVSVGDIDKMVITLSLKAEGIYKEIKKMDFEMLKAKVMLQECYQLKKMFDEADIDWRPTGEMVARIKNKSLLSGLLPHGKMMSSFDEYVETFYIKEFARDVLGTDF